MSKLITPDPTDAVGRLGRERPDWIPVLEAAVAVAATVEEHGGEFAGAWVVDELAKRGRQRWIPNLRILVAYGLLEKSGPSTRGGRRAYYRMPHRQAVEDALAVWQTTHGTNTPRALSFVAAGASNDAPADVARRSGEVDYEPRSWR